ncbi:phage holin family protein [Bacillus mobilis]|uniref:phage holin family protein n=1 Tax=Bacillus mobilis TaxID=2026190 RepID=UPI003D66136D
MDKYIFAAFGTGVTFLFGSWHTSLTVLCVFMVLDIITGVTKGAINKNLKSKIGYMGFLRKANIMVVIIMANMLDLITDTGMPVFRTMATFFYVGLEGLSIVENLEASGVKIPIQIKERLAQVQERKEIPPHKTDMN